MKKFLLFSCLMLSICILGKAQFYNRNVITPAGDYFTAGGIRVTWVLGDLVTGAYDIGQLIVPSGTGIPHPVEPASRIAVFPNPSSGLVYIELNMDHAEHYYYYLFDILGREISCNPLTQSLSELNLASLDNGVYILRITKDDINIKEFKIIKQ